MGERGDTDSAAPPGGTVARAGMMRSANFFVSVGGKCFFFFTALPTRSASEALAVACCDTPASQHGEYGRARGVVRREIERRE